MALSQVITSPLSADDTTILYQTNELPYWELNDDNCLAVLAKKPVDQLGTDAAGEDDYYDSDLDLELDEDAAAGDEGEGEGDDYEVCSSF